MADNNDKKTSASAGEAAGSGARKKKIIKIKKKDIPSKKDISDHFQAAPKKKSAPGAAASGPAPKGKPAGTGSQDRTRAPQKDQPAARSGKPATGQDNRSQRGGQKPAGGRPAAKGGPQQKGAPRPGQDKRKSGDGVSRVTFAGAGTPFDALIESSKKAASANQMQSRRGGPPGGARGGRGGPPDSGPGGPGGRRRRDSEDDAMNRLARRYKKRQPTQSGTTVPSSIEIMESIQIGELAKKLNLKPNDVIARLMKMGEMVTINQVIDAEKAELVASEFGCEVKVISLYEETVIKEEEDDDSRKAIRPPVVTIMGHVDHGKTKLLDTIRTANVIDTEAGAITQHIGAYQVETPNGKITFLDTPGHEAFTAMRARGAAVTDIVILVVAADDGVKEQTIEAISHAKEAEVPIIVAVNKIDLPAANVEKVTKELAQHGLQAENWGGDTVFCEISAKNNIGIDHLLDMILLQAELLELKADPDVRAVGHVVEAKVDPGKGPVATILVEKGTIREGEPFVVGVYSGKVRAMFDDYGKRLTEAPPATPVEITGIDGVPAAGDPFQIVESEKFAREMSGTRQHYKQISEAADRGGPSLDALQNWMADHQELKVIVKADVQGSVEAIKDGLLKLSGDDVKVRVIFGGTGAISESDVSLAAASAAIIIGFHVRAVPSAIELSERSGVEIKYYNIIYNVIEDVQKAMEGMLAPDQVEEVTGQAEIRQVFKISRIGNIAGCMVTKGKIHRNNKIRLIRDNVVIYEGELASLKRVKDDVNEVSEGFECGLSIKGYNDIVEGDVVESFTVKEVARKLG